MTREQAEAKARSIVFSSVAAPESLQDRLMREIADALMEAYRAGQNSDDDRGQW